MKKVYIINGPNLNLLGEREPHIYGNKSLNDLNKELEKEFINLRIVHFQSNYEGEIIEYIQSIENNAYAVLNLAAYTHTSIAIRDALLAKEIKFVEVHITNPLNREPFRAINYFSDIALHTYSGMGTDCYFEAIKYLLNK